MLPAVVVYESVGQTLMDSFRATKTGGTVVFFGMAGGNRFQDVNGYIQVIRRRPLERPDYP